MVVITGGTGLLGKYLKEELEKQKIPYKVLSRKNNDYEETTLTEHLKGMHTLVHLAGSRKQKDTLKDYFDEQVLLERLLEIAKENKLKHIIIASSISVYSGIPPFRESDVPNPKTLYGVNKLLLEHRARLFSEKHDMNITCLRLSHLFGKDEENNYMINLFMRKALNRVPLMVSGSSTVKREFLYARDAALAILKVMSTNTKGFRVYNVAGLECFTNFEIAASINRAFQNEGLFHQDKDIEDPFKPSHMNGEKIFKEVGFTPDYTLQGALLEIYEEMKEHDVPVFY